LLKHCVQMTMPGPRNILSVLSLTHGREIRRTYPQFQVVKFLHWEILSTVKRTNGLSIRASPVQGWKTQNVTEWIPKVELLSAFFDV
jgi:hypothetical protein